MGFVTADAPVPEPGESQIVAPQLAQPPAPVSTVVDTQLPLPDSVDKTLAAILSWCRPHGTHSEDYFVNWLKAEIVSRGGDPEMKATNVVCVIPREAVEDKGVVTKKLSDVLFSCHVDTVHAQGGKQNVVYDPGFGHVFLDDATSNCLGADDGVGVWLMLEMIQRKVPGTYVFHRGEERGGVGSNEMLKTERTWLSQFRVAVAFDRPRNNEVITHQGGLRCCSDKFADALAKALNDACPYFSYAKSDRGVFTDTKVYRGVIDECTNIGVGYENQHGKDETLNYAHAELLRDAVCTVNWDALPIDRDCKKPEPYEWRGYGGYAQGRGWKRGGFGWEDWQEQQDFFSRPAGRSTWRSPISTTPAGTGWEPPKSKSKKKGKKPPVSNAHPIGARAPMEPTLDPLAETEGMTYDEIVEWVNLSPEDAAAHIIDLAAEVVGLREKLKYLRGVKR